MKQQIIHYFRKRRKLIILSIVFLLIQLPFLDQLSLLRGERDIALTSWSLAKTGRDLFGRLLPLEFTGIDPNVPFVPFYINALWWLLVPIKSVFTVRLFYVLISTVLPFLIYEIILSINKEDKVAFVSACIFVLSPGIFFLSRLGLEIGIAFPLLLYGILQLIHKKRISSYILFILAFYSYHGFRPLIPFLISYIELFHIVNQRTQGIIIKKYFRVFLGFLFGIVLIATSFFIDGSMMKSRSNDFIFGSFNQWSNQIDYRRNTSIAPKKIAALFDNKLTALGTHLKDNLFGGIGFEYLFTKGDPSSLYATTFSGQFFLTFVVFFFLGFFVLGKRSKRTDVFLVGLIPLGMIPSLTNVSYFSYSIRSILSSVGWTYLFALGMIFLWELLKKVNVNIKRFCIALLFLFFSIELIYFGYNFYFRRTITMSELYFESERILPNYLLSLTVKKPLYVYVSTPRDAYYAYVFFNTVININDVHKINKVGKPYQINGIVFDQCQKNQKQVNSIISDKCLSEEEYEALDKQTIKKLGYTDYSFRTAFFVFE